MVNGLAFILHFSSLLTAQRALQYLPFIHSHKVPSTDQVSKDTSTCSQGELGFEPATSAHSITIDLSRPKQ